LTDDFQGIIKEHLSQIDSGVLIDVLAKKLKHKKILLKTIDELFPADLRSVQRYWDEDLGHQVNNLPPLDEVLAELRIQLQGLIKPGF
jgi:hypothetical protein